jgi:hypothetical protein
MPTQMQTQAHKMDIVQPLDILEIQYCSSKQDLKVMPPQLFDKLNPSGTWKAIFLQHHDFTYKQEVFIL